MRSSKRALSSGRQKRKERYKHHRSTSGVLTSSTLHSSNSYALLQTKTSSQYEGQAWLSSRTVHSPRKENSKGDYHHSDVGGADGYKRSNNTQAYEGTTARGPNNADFFTASNSDGREPKQRPTTAQLHRRSSSLRSIANRRDNPNEAVGEFSTLWDFLKAELTTNENDATAELKRERVTNFIHVPQEIEKLFTFGYFICLDSFMHVFTILPMRVLLAMQQLLVYMMGRARQLKAAHKVDLIKALLVSICCIALQLIDASQLYHGVRGQSLIKLYVIYNMLEIFDKLFCSFGQDILDSFFFKIGDSDDNDKKTGASTSRIKHLHPISHFIIASIYMFIHSMILFYQLVTLNVAINSYHNSLLTMLLSNQFVEIKSNVFKRFEKENLFQLTCADIVERFQLTVFLIIIAIRNVVELSGTTMSSSLPASFFPLLPTGSIFLYNVLTPVILVFGCEMLVDWLKHAFITKFNHIRPTVYQRYAEILSRDLVVGADGGSGSGSNGGVADNGQATRRRFIDHSPVVARRMGLATLPLGCLVIRNAIQLIRMLNLRDASETQSDEAALFRTMVLSTDDWRTKCLVAMVWLLLIMVLYICLVFLKLTVGVNLFRYASAKYAQMRQREQTSSEWEHAAADSKRLDADYRNQVKSDLSKDPDLTPNTARNPVTLENIDRFTLFKSRIP
ncbi:eukaryotic membrane protein family-domain-containing protein [Syncephalis plumigaleata]|nr:eukaryotic membrane protein family-domain-containing protein [Syncephalis plumigaleata]